MPRFRPILHRLRGLFRRRVLEAEMNAELRAHLDGLIERNIAAGMSFDEARYAALRAFGGVAQIEERCRDQRGIPWLEHVARDLRFAARTLRRAPWFTLAAVATLALGIGLGTAVFGFARVVLQSPLRLPEAEALVRVWSVRGRDRASSATASWTLFQQLAQHREVFQSVGVSGPTGFTYLDGENPLSVGGARITSSLLSTLGAPLLHGRGFTPEEEAPGGPPVALLAPQFWRTALGGRADIVGHKIILDGVSHEVIGVVAEDVAQLDAGGSVYLPRPFDLPGMTRERAARGGLSLAITARLQPGVTLARANAALQRIAADYRRTYPAHADVGHDVMLRPYADEIAGPARPTAMLLMSAVGCLLLLAVTNTGSLCVTRALHRRHDLSVRLALGADTPAVVRAVLGELALLVVAAGVGGVLLAHWTLPIIEHFARPFLPRLPAFAFAGPEWFFAIATMSGVFVILAVISLWHVVKVGVVDSLRSARSVVGGTRLQGPLVALQVAVTFALLIAGALLLLSYRKLSHTTPGFDTAGLVTGFVNLPVRQYPTSGQQTAFFLTAVERIRAADPALEVAAVSAMPLTRNLAGTPFLVADHPPVPEDARPVAIARHVSDEYFRVMRIPLRAGRSFNADDRAGAPDVGVINESLARRLFGAESALGKILLSPDGGIRTEIVGVVGDVLANGLTAEPTDEIYRSLRQRGRAQMAFVVRSTRAPSQVRDLMASAVASLDRQRSLAVFQTSEQFLARSWGSQRLAAWTTGVFAIAALTLAAVGLYGLVACWAAQRTREFGVRMALGADRRDISRLALTQGMKFVAMGLAVGVAVYFASSTVVSRVLHGVHAFDSVALAAAVGALALVALVACLLPARRAAKIDPIVALRAE